MSLESVACNRCGTSLELAPGVRFVTCRSCGATLTVQRTDSSTWTEAAADGDRLGRVEQNVDQLNVRNELEMLDRQWEREREEYMTVTRYGARHVPNKQAAVFGGAIIAGFGLLWTIFAASMVWSTTGLFGGGGHDGFPPPPGFGPPAIINCFPLFGVLFIAGGVGMSIYAYRMAEKYEAAKARYEAKRAEIEKKLSR